MSLNTLTNLSPSVVDDHFPRSHQRQYVVKLSRRVGFTRRRAECFVRLIAYLMLKSLDEQGRALPAVITELTAPDDHISCTLRETFELFYGNSDRGSERSAGMMLDELVKLGVIDKQFDGNTLCIKIRSLPQSFESVDESAESSAPLQFVSDDFNPNTDTVLVSRFLATNYNWMNASAKAVPAKIARLLRKWSREYAKGIRVLRRVDNQQPVGCYILFPVAAESEENFCLPPSRGLHLSTNATDDPFQMAQPGDLSCTALLVRSIMIDRLYMQPDALQILLEDGKQCLLAIRKDFPNACDLYGLTIHPMHEELARVTGFQKIDTDPHLSIHWIYQAIDHYLQMDVAHAVAQLKLS